MNKSLMVEKQRSKETPLFRNLNLASSYVASQINETIMRANKALQSILETADIKLIAQI